MPIKRMAMAHQFTLPFYAFKLHLFPGRSLLRPMTDLEAVRIGQPLHLVAGAYAEELQRKILNKGNIRPLLDELRSGAFLRSRLRIPFPAARDGFSYPAFELEFDFFYNQQPKGWWGIVPVLGVEGFSKKLPELAQRLEEAVHLEFGRNRRLGAVQNIVSTIWFESIELLQHEIDLQAPSPREVDALLEQPEERLLPRVAQELKIERQVTYCRETELEQFARALKSDFSRNVLLVGPSGSGKTALVWEISRQFKKRRIKGRIWETTASTLIKELTRNTGWQDNLAYLCRELTYTDDILFIRNLMDLFEVGKYEGNELAIADYLRSYLSRGEISIISECTEEEMANIDLRSPNYLNLFHSIRLEEPKEDLERIILRKVNAVASVRRAGITEDAIREVIRLHRRFTPYSGMPGKPIRFLETILINEPVRSRPRQDQQIDRREVIRYFCEETGMPPFMIDPGIPLDARQVKKQFNQTVFGQEAAVDALVSLLVNVKTALTRTGQPIASLLFVGPTGVGKTELAKVLAEFMFGSRERLTRFDMSEFSSPYSVMRLIGTDYRSSGLLTSAIRREPFTVLLFDEIEKADSSFFDLLLQLLSEGRLTDSQGKLVNFCSTIIIMTSNIGAGNLQGQRIGWQRDLRKEEVQGHFQRAVQRHFRPELINRIDQIIPFAPLDPRTVRYVVERELHHFRRREGVAFRNLQLQIDDALLDYLAERGYDAKYGARHLQRTIREELIIPLARILNIHEPEDQLQVRATLSDEGPSLQVEADPLSIELLLEKLNKIELADHASALRRNLYQLMEGPFYIQLVNDLDLLEQRRRKKDQHFWSQAAEVDRYTYYLRTREKIETLQQKIETFEMDLSLASLDLHSFQPQLAEELDHWEKELFDLKVELYTRLNPDSNRCHLGFYGKPLLPLVQLYLDIIREKQYSSTAKAVWHREAYYNEEIETTDERGARRKKKREAYLYSDLVLPLKSVPKPPKKGDLFYGIELDIQGPAAYLYFNEEGGLQRWENEPNQFDPYVLKVNKAPGATPEKIHRKEFYRTHSPRRTVQQSAFRDTLYKINREIDGERLQALLVEHLDKRFRIKLDMEIL